MYTLILINIKIKIDKNIILLLENVLLFLKLNGKTILDFGKIFPNNYNNLEKLYHINKIKDMKQFDFFSFDLLPFFYSESIRL